MDRPAPETQLGHPLQAHHGRHRRALLIRHALRGASWCAVAVAAVVAWGVAAAPAGASTAWVRLLLLVAAFAVALGFAIRGFLADSIPLAALLERIEERFPALRSWIRNALDFERVPPSYVSPDLAQAVRLEASRRLAE